MITIFDSYHRGALLRRLASLTPDRTAEWGRMTAHQMIAHLTDAFRVSLDDPPAAPAKGKFARFPLNWLAIHVLPWPKGKLQSPPEFLTFKTTTWDADVATLKLLIERAGERGPAGAWSPSPAFGNISGRSWGALLAKHTDHHLRQFGAGR